MSNVEKKLIECRDCLNKAILEAHKARDQVNLIIQQMAAPKKPAVIYDITTGAKKLPPAPCEGE